MRYRIPVGKIAEVVAKGRESWASLAEELVVHVWVDPDVARWIPVALKGALVPQMAASQVEVRDLEAFVGGVSNANLAIVLCGGSDDLVRRAAASYAGQGIPCAVCAETSLDVPEMDVPDELVSYVSPVVGSHEDALLDALASWMLDCAPDPVSVAANFEFCRSMETERLIQRCAMTNAAVGTVDVLHGADLPIMLVNQSKLAFDLAASHGEGMSASRVAEVAAVVAAGLVYRAVSRGVSSRVPGLAFAVRGAVGYAGSVATGRALALRFGERDEALEQALSVLGERVSRGVSAVTQAARAASEGPRSLQGFLGQAADDRVPGVRRHFAANACDEPEYDVPEPEGAPADAQDASDPDFGYIVLEPGVDGGVA